MVFIDLSTFSLKNGSNFEKKERKREKAGKESKMKYLYAKNTTKLFI